MIFPLATFGNFMGMDGLMILVIVLLLFGARKLPELARGLGQSLNEFKKARDDFEHELNHAQKEPQVQTPDGRQSFAPAAVPVQATALPYHAPVQTAAAPEAQAALQQRIADLEQKLHSALEQSKQPSSHVG